MCGMDRADIEAVTGYTVERSGGELTVVDGVGAGECSAWAPEDSQIAGSLVNVQLSPALSADGDEARAMLAGEIDGVREADEVYTSRVGAIWGDVLNVGDLTSTTTIGTSYVFVGDTLVTLLISRGDSGRDRPADQLALTEQIAATYGLEPDADGS